MSGTRLGARNTRKQNAHGSCPRGACRITGSTLNSKKKLWFSVTLRKIYIRVF